MSAPIVLAIGILGGIGALARHLLDGAIGRRHAGDFPLGILAVNLSGALLLGAYTTFSTWMLQSRRLAQDGAPALAVLNLAGSLALGLLAVWLGREFGAAL